MGAQGARWSEVERWKTHQNMNVMNPFGKINIMCICLAFKTFHGNSNDLFQNIVAKRFGAVYFNPRMAYPIALVHQIHARMALEVGGVPDEGRVDLVRVAVN